MAGSDQSEEARAIEENVRSLGAADRLFRKFLFGVGNPDANSERKW